MRIIDCACGHKIICNKLNYIGTSDFRDFGFIHQFNCKSCDTTRSIINPYNTYDFNEKKTSEQKTKQRQHLFFATMNQVNRSRDPKRQRQLIKRAGLIEGGSGDPLFSK